MKLTQAVTQEFFFPRLAHRRDTFYRMIEHLDLFSQYECNYIVETGTSRNRDTWEAEGQSTRIWDWVCHKDRSFKAISIDISPENIEVAKSNTTLVEYICDDSVKSLSQMDNHIISNTRLLYLDSFDFYPEKAFESSFHHLCELTTVWSKLSPGTMIVVDDRLSPTSGKHTLVEMFMEKLGIKPVFSEYQIGWEK